MKIVKIVNLMMGLSFSLCTLAENDWRLVWSDEFETDGPLDSSVWNFEQGYARNEEAQWYQQDNAICRNGYLIIEARKEKDRKNPLYVAGSKDWRKKREFVEYTSSSVTTAGKKEFLYGRFEIKARIPVAKGAWPAIWALGRDMEWPSCGEIDIMEYYQIKGVPHILANAAWGTDRQWHAKWDSQATPYSHFTDKDPDWASKFHIWRMDWDEEAIKLYLDDELLNEIPLKNTINGKIGKGTNPFTRPQYLLLNLAIGGINGGPIDEAALPMKYEIDYVRVYQKEKKIASGEVWRDMDGELINAHGGWVVFTLTLPALSPDNQKEKRITSEYIPEKIYMQPMIKLPDYEFDKMRPTILVIDDEIEILWLIGEIFSNDFNVVTLQDAGKTEDVLNEMSPNVIICDIKMPDTNGIELVKRIKSQKETSHIPIIIISGHYEMQQQMEAISSGAEMYITKPFSTEFLRISVMQVMERKERLKSYFSSPISSFEKTEGKLMHRDSKKFLQSVLKIINDNITNSELTTKFIAEKLAMSSRSLYRKMEETGNGSPATLIKFCRLHVAKDLLLTTHKTVDEIVFDSGFSNKVSFFKAFREMYGCTPKDFRKRQLKEINEDNKNNNNE